MGGKGREGGKEGVREGDVRREGYENIRVENG